MSQEEIEKHAEDLTLFLWICCNKGSLKSNRLLAVTVTVQAMSQAKKWSKSRPPSHIRDALKMFQQTKTFTGIARVVSYICVKLERELPCAKCTSMQITSS